MIGDAGETNGTEKNRVVAFQLFNTIVRHHAAALGIGLAIPGKAVPCEADVETSPGRLEHTHSFWNHFFTNTISGNYGDLVCFHIISLGTR